MACILKFELLQCIHVLPPTVLCNLLTVPTNGSISYSNDTRDLGTVATYSCDPGYEVMGDMTRTCDSADTWSGTDTTCEGETVWL